MTAATLDAVSGIGRPSPSFELALHARNRSPKMFRGYLEAVALFESFLVERGIPTGKGAIAREHVETFILTR